VADLLTHVLTAYVLATLLSLRDGRITPAAVTTAMVGGVVPDLNRIDLLVPASTVEATLGVPFAWDALSTVGGVVVVIALGVLLVPPRLRPLTAAMLSLGVGSHFVLDYLLLFPSGYTHPYLWPLVAGGLPGPGLYLSSDRWPAAVAVVVAGLTWAMRRSADSPAVESADRRIAPEQGVDAERAEQVGQKRRQQCDPDTPSEAEHRGGAENREPRLHRKQDGDADGHEDPAGRDGRRPAEAIRRRPADELAGDVQPADHADREDADLPTDTRVGRILDEVDVQDADGRGKADEREKRHHERRRSGDRLHSG